jgi:SAM-dependent methyltransferase
VVTDASQGLELTGERTVPGIAHENYWFRRHEAAYLALAPFCLGARLLEAGCGEGYGADLLARTAQAHVVALDADAQAITHVGRRYRSVHAVRADLQRLPLRDAAVEVVATLQVVEHLWDQRGFVAECARVLTPAGTLLLTTPNRLTFSPGRTTPLNPFHTREFAPAELVALLEARFAVTRLYGLHHGRRLRRFERRRGPLVDTLISGPPESWPEPVRRFVPTVRAADFVVTEDDVGAALDLLVVAVRW